MKYHALIALGIFILVVFCFNFLENEIELSSINGSFISGYYTFDSSEYRKKLNDIPKIDKIEPSEIKSNIQEREKIYKIYQNQPSLTLNIKNYISKENSFEGSLTIDVDEYILVNSKKIYYSMCGKNYDYTHCKTYTITLDSPKIDTLTFKQESENFKIPTDPGLIKYSNGKFNYLKIEANMTPTLTDELGQQIPFTFKIANFSSYNITSKSQKEEKQENQYTPNENSITIRLITSEILAFVMTALQGAFISYFSVCLISISLRKEKHINDIFQLVALIVTMISLKDSFSSDSYLNESKNSIIYLYLPLTIAFTVLSVAEFKSMFINTKQP